MEIISEKHSLIYYNVNVLEINNCHNLLMQSEEAYDVKWIQDEQFDFVCKWQRSVFRDKVELIKLRSKSIIKFAAEVNDSDFSALYNILKTHEIKNIQIIKNNNLNFSEHNENIYYSSYLNIEHVDNSEFSFNNQLKEMIRIKKTPFFK